MTEDNMFDEVQGLETAQDVDTHHRDVIALDLPPFWSLEWNDYAMGLFDQSELVDGKPVNHGLKRVAEQVLGRIVSSKPVDMKIQEAGGAEIGRATVMWEVMFEDGSVFGDVSDCWIGNTEAEYAVHTSATAATKAENRALRKALRLKTCSFEEITNIDVSPFVAATTGKSVRKVKPVTDGEYDKNETVDDQQLSFLNVKMRDLNINGQAIVEEKFSCKPREMTKQQATKIIDMMTEFQRDTQLIDASYLGYDKNWRE